MARHSLTVSVAVARHVEHQRIARPVVMVDAGLAARRGMQIDDGEKAGLAYPSQHAIEQRPALARDLALVGHEQVVVQRDAHGIEADRLDEADVVARDVGVADTASRTPPPFGTQQAIEGAEDLARRLGDLELEHVALGHQPVAEADALDAERPAVRGDEGLAVDARELLRCRGRGQAKEKQQESDQKPSPPAQRGEREGTRAKPGEGEVGHGPLNERHLRIVHHLTLPLLRNGPRPSPPLRGGEGK